MAAEWYLMGAMPVYNSGYEKEEFDMYSKDSFTEVLETSPVSETIQIINHDLTLISEIKAVVLNNVADSTTKSVERYVLAIIGTLTCGDYISYDGKTWLVTSFVGNNGIYEKAIIELCTFVLKFQSPSGTILSYPCIDESSNTVGIDESNQINTLNSIKRIKCPFDDNTKLLKVDRRFFVDKSGTTTYFVTNVNNTEFNYGNKGLVVLTMKTDSAYNPQTDKNGVCNYFEPTVEPETPVEGETYSTITSSGQLTIDRKRTITATAYNADGSINSDISLVWIITKPNGYENDIAYTVIGNTCTVEIAENYELIDLVVKFEVSDGYGEYVGSKEFIIGV